MRISRMRVAAAVLIGAGVVTAAAVGVSVKYRFVEKRPEQGYIVQSEDGHSTMNVPENHAASPEQAVATAEEIARLKQQGQRELVGVIEIGVNGQPDSRLFRWKYDLADGRTITVGERDPDDNAPMTLVRERQAEAGRLLRQTAVSGQYEQVFQGRTFVFGKREFTLSDGTQVAWSIGKLKVDQ